MKGTKEMNYPSRATPYKNKRYFRNLQNLVSDFINTKQQLGLASKVNKYGTKKKTTSKEKHNFKLLPSRYRRGSLFRPSDDKRTINELG